MDHYSQTFSSNRAEALYQGLKERLFTSPHPFAKRLIIVPSPAMKSWLTLQMAKDPDLGIAAGIDIGLLPSSINKLCRLLGDGKRAQDAYEPSELELALALEACIVDVVKNSQSKQSEWQPLLHSLGIEGPQKNLSIKVSRRIAALASALAKAFVDYGIYGGKLFESWKAEKANRWQQLLWEKMEALFSQWFYPIRNLKDFEIRTDYTSEELQVHVFGLSYLPPLYLHFLHKISLQFPVYHYLLSPCQKFWGDILSDKEGIKLKRFWKQNNASVSSQESLENILRDRNPLLANFGRLGREMATAIDSVNPLSFESYVLPESVQQHPVYAELLTDEVHLQASTTPLTLLEAIQSDITLLRNPNDTGKIDFTDYDATIQIHATPKKMREVEVIYNTLLEIIDKHSKDSDPIQPGDIFVMTPKISEYTPYIKSVFESSDSKFSIQLVDAKIPSEHSLVRGFLHLLQLSKGRWEASTLLQLFEYEHFRRCQQLSNDDLSIIQKWIKAAKISWGNDHLHRDELLKSDYEAIKGNDISPIGSWENGIERLIEGLVLKIDETSIEDNPLSHHPINRIESSQSDLLGSLIRIIRSLREDLKPLANHTKLPLKEWAAYLKCLLETYFSRKTQDGSDEGYKILCEHLQAFDHSSQRLKEAKFSFDSIHTSLEAQLNKETVVYKDSNLHAIRFSSLLPMRSVPAKVVVLMGMGDGEFPRTGQSTSLNLLFSHPHVDYYPEAVDFDRYLFLEALLSTRRYFVLSYISQEPANTKEIAPSLLVRELINYLDQAYSVSTKTSSAFCLFKHALDPFHSKYFTAGSRYKSFSLTHYKAALAHYNSDKLAPHSFLKTIEYTAHDPEKLVRSTVNLKDLIAYAKSPLKKYLKNLGVYIQDESDRKVDDEDDLFLSDLNSAKISRSGIFNDMQHTLDRAQKVGLLPTGSFKSVGNERIEHEISAYKSNLKAHGISENDLFSIELSERHEKPIMAGKCLHLPPLSLKSESFGDVEIIGKIENVCSKGWIHLTDDSIKKGLELWPVILVLHCLIKTHHLAITPQLIFIRAESSNVKRLDIDQAENLLMRYLEYFFKAETAPLPFIPDWIEPIISGKIDHIQSAFDQDTDDTYKRQYDPYMKWLKRSSPNFDLAATIDLWQPKTRDLFAALTSPWSKKCSPQGQKDGSHDNV